MRTLCEIIDEEIDGGVLYMCEDGVPLLQHLMTAFTGTRQGIQEALQAYADDPKWLATFWHLLLRANWSRLPSGIWTTTIDDEVEDWVWCGEVTTNMGILPYECRLMPGVDWASNVIDCEELQ